MTTRSRATTATGGRAATTGLIEGSYALAVGKPGTPTSAGFHWIPLSDLARLESGHTPSRKVPAYWNGDVPWVGVRDATGNHGRVITHTNQMISQEGVANSSTRILPAGTVCLSRTASVGFVVQMSVPMATSQDFVNWVCGPELDSDYLRYLLLAEHNSMRRFASGTVHQTIYYPEAKAFHVCVPSLERQQAISATLRTLDDKIRANERLSSTCERLAFSIFQAVAEEAKGSTRALTELVDVTKGVSYRSADLEENDDVALVTLKSIGRTGGYQHRGLKAYTGPYKPAQVVRDGEVVVAQTDLTQAAEVIGRAVRVPALAGPTRVASLDLAVLRPKSSSGLSNEYLWGLLTDSSWREHALGYANGTTVLHLASRCFGDFAVTLPSCEVIATTSETMSTLLHRAEVASTESLRLTALRDALLPELLTGRTTVNSTDISKSEPQ